MIRRKLYLERKMKHFTKSRTKVSQKNKTRRRTTKTILLKNTTPVEDLELSELVLDEIEKEKNNKGKGRGIKIHSYSPTINQQLVSLKSIAKTRLSNCNNERAFRLKESLQIGIPGDFFGKTCVPYTHHEAKRLLLRNLSANKHINPNNVVPPRQLQSNCWFNAMFTAFFISDKGRKFFHYFRQLMIEGKQNNGDKIPEKLADAFALLNFAIDSALMGTPYAYELDTNGIIQQIYLGILENYPTTPNQYFVDVDQASNPIRYYQAMLQYLNNKSIQMLFVEFIYTDWLKRTTELLKNITHMPHIIVLEIPDESSKTIKNRFLKFKVSGAKYALDSCIIRDKTQQHFCTLFMCEGNEVAYDGQSYHRMIPMEWKKLINTNTNWKFEGSTDANGKLLEWNFLQGYQMLVYYRIE